MTEVHPSALVLLETPDAKRLAVAWQYLDERDRSDEAWARLAAIPRHRATAHQEILRRSGICLPDGTVAELALKYISAITTRPLRPAKVAK